MKYRAEIDGLRALAVMPVILFHAGFEWFSGGFVGVDVFFVISGYLITTIIISEMAEGKFSIVNFYERRARRILPALFFVMAVCLPFAWLWLIPADLKDFGQSLVAVSTFSSNILFLQESGYFDTTAELKPLLHTWSLAVEEQYYILFPIFLMLTWRLGIKWVLILLSVVFLLSFGVAQWGAYNKPSATFYLLPTRGWELLVGVFAAFYLKHNTHLKSHILNQALSLLGFGMIAYSIIAFDETTPFPSSYTLIPTIGTGLIILCAVPNSYIHKLLSLKFVVGIGLISYSAYLWHQPLLAFAKYRLLDNVPVSLMVVICIFSLVFGWFSWRFIERPFRSKEMFDRKKIFSISIGFLLAFSTIGLMLNFSTIKGFGNSNLINGYWDKGISCSYPTLGYEEILCEDELPNLEEKSVLFIGDSLLNSSIGGILDASDKMNLSVSIVPKLACPALYKTSRISSGKVDKECLEFNKRVFEDFLPKHVNKYDLIVFYSAFNRYLHNGLAGFVDNHHVCQSVESCTDSFRNSIVQTIEYMESLGTKFIFIEQYPRYEILKDGFTDPLRAEKFGANIQMLRALHNEDASKFISLFNDRSEQIRRTTSIFCGDTYCSPSVNGQTLYINGDHLGYNGSLYMSTFWQELFELSLQNNK